MKLAAILLSFLLFAYASACAYLYFKQRSLLYFPTPETSLPGVQSVAFESHGETLKIWRIGQGEHALLYFGGNAENVSFNIPDFSARLDLNKYTVFLVNYRGYGGSTGTPTEKGLFDDALAIYDWVQKQYANVVVMGRSLGSGVGMYVASQRTIHKLVLITPYDSITTVAKTHFPAFPVFLLLTDKFDSRGRAAAIRAPTLILLAQYDEVIPLASSEALIQAFEQVQPIVEVLPGATHNSISADNRYWERLREFL